MSKTLKMWGHRGSSCCQKVLWSAAELGLSIDLTDTGGGYGGLGAPDYLARNPNRVVPTIEDDGFVMWESSAILLYLATAYGRGTLEPEDARARGEAYRWTVWQDTTMRPKLLPLYHSWIVVENPMSRHLDELEEKRKGMFDTWMIVERHLAGRDYMAGDQFSLADIPMGVMAYWWYLMPIDHFDLPNIEAWYARISARPAFKEQVLR
ncbi:MAG: glutathione S-transferase family protein [Rhodospirillaceae bacterium]|jgi:glutathione S-transferase|nr:glutathione S-transferase family protein [Rhodospirillaceae bacterium]MBT5664897.1 glutathione S-transferase family protein [Rhodospirillaceae bacterium]MBT5810328.1 glutathione S-transferase family protein [Rhodospirillaceae bacterium]